MATEETRELLIQLVSVELDKTLKNQKGIAYTGAEVIYKDEEGKVTTKVMHNSTFRFNGALLEQLKDAKDGMYYLVDAKKVGQFVNWESITMTDTPKVEAKPEAPKETPKMGGSTPTQTQVRSNYETPEERAQKQVYIVRQSSLTAALKLAELGLSTGNQAFFTEEDIITSAKVFERYVLGFSDPAIEVNLPD
jgi:hypothetical protein